MFVLPEERVCFNQRSFEIGTRMQPYIENTKHGDGSSLDRAWMMGGALSNGGRLSALRVSAAERSLIA